ncbi:DEAD/DEAH box helicase family protein [Rudaea sp.]|uniref:DEAD/DEAH box helicase family protein n=1 Tax=Rudaea sp. TaxID=2136325 RepID=UPI00322079D7
MTPPPSEADARILIDDLLRAAGWNPADKSQVRTEVPVMELFHVAEIGIGGGGMRTVDSGSLGFIDYVLFDQRGRPLAVIEAKKQAINPYTAKQQALPYAKKIGAPFIFLTNGELTYFWDYQNDDARSVASLFSRRDLERLVHLRSERKPLAEVEIPETYVRTGETRSLRAYQQEAMKALDHAAELGKRRFLIELPTGCGKTDLIALYLKRLIQAGHAERILFLVDREQLAKQAIEAIQDLLPQYSSYWLKPGVARQEKQITVCLLQTMMGRVEDLSSGYFDVVVMDECHRSIYGAWQTALAHFDALHIGLTATPAMYIERNTFNFYQCKDNTPDYSYSIQEAFKQGHLVPYKFATGITTLVSEGTEKDGVEYDPAEFERNWTNEASNKLMMAEFDKLAWANYKELAPGQKDGPGKSVVFAITKHHAARLAQYLNDLHPEYKGKYAEVITSDIADADDAIRRFKQDKLPMVAVSVGMLDTGFDCREVLHLVMCRRVRSPILYQQMRGRGTRTAPHIGKQKFVIYDFFGNHDYFNDSDTDVFTGSGGGGYRKPQRGSGPTGRELVELGLDDEWLQAVSYIEVGPDGERVDKREYVTDWEKTVQQGADNDPVLAKIKAGQSLSEQEEIALAQRLNQPQKYFNEDNLRRAYRKPGGNLVDFIREALGLIKTKSRPEIIEENFRAWLVSKNFSPEQAQYLSLLKNRGISKGKVSIDDLFSPPLSLLNAAGLGIEMFGEAGLSNVLDEINTAVLVA